MSNADEIVAAVRGALAAAQSGTQRPTWLGVSALRERWGDGQRPMPASTFYDRLRRQLIPAPEHPFGGNRPFWRLTTIEAFEQGGKEAA